MRKLIMQQWISMDGYASDANVELDFFPPADNNRYSDEDQLKFLETIDTMILGRKTYELFVDFWPTAKNEQEIIADKLNELDKVVVSTTLKQAGWGNYPSAQIIRENVVETIRRLKQQDGKNIVVWDSITLSKLLMKENMFDEYILQLCPTTTGGGTKLFADTYRNFKLVKKRMYDKTGVVYLRYMPG